MDFAHSMGKRHAVPPYIADARYVSLRRAQAFVDWKVSTRKAHRAKEIDISTSYTGMLFPTCVGLAPFKLSTARL